MNANPLDRFRAALLGDPQHAQALAAHQDPQAFEAAAIGWAAARGIPLERALLDHPMPAIERADLPPIGWLPVRVRGGETDWVHFAGEGLTDPFFEETAHRVGVRPFNRLFRVRIPLDALIAHAPPAVAPTGLIFHMSRCGSTLAAQMLAADSSNLVLSEPPTFDAVLLDPALDEDRKIAALRALASAYMRGRPGGRLFVKLDSWHTRALPLLRRAFPETPWIFLYREPIEVIVSHLRRPGLHAVPGLAPASFLGLGGADVPGPDFIARALRQMCDALCAHWHLGAGLLVAYSEMPDALFTRILPHFGVTPTPHALAAMAEAGRRDAKHGGAFASDTQAKRRSAPPEAVAAAQRHLSQSHARLNRLRG